MNPDEQKPVEPAAAHTTQPAAKKKLSKNALIGIIAGAVILVGVIGWAVYAAIANSPENLMKAAVQNLVNDKQAAGTFAIESGAQQEATKMQGDFAVVRDANNDKNGQLVVGIGTDDKRFALHALALDKTVYLKASNAENLSALYGGSSITQGPQIAAMLKNINDQWFELSEQDVKSIASTTTGDTAAAPVSASPEDLNRLMQIYDQHSFVKADKVFADEVVDGANSAHFSLRLDRDEYVKFMQAVKDANLATVKVTDKNIEDAKKEEERIKDGSIELWIARDSKKFKQLRVVNTKKGQESTVTFTFTGKLPKLEKFEKPADALPISALMSMLLGPSINQTELNALENAESFAN